MKTTYWLSTGLLCLFLLWSAYSYLYSRSTIDGVQELGFPDFFRIQLAVLKLMAIVVLLLPQVPFAVKEWAYAGVGLFLLTAIVAHVAHGDPWGITLINMLLIALLIVSRMYWQKLVLPL